jgi:excisionase family DNA binding protein
MKYISVRDFAQALGVTRQAVHLRLEAGDIRFERVGCVRMIPESELGKWSKAAPKGLGRSARFIERVGKQDKRKSPA